jgi:hypothetical protein
MAIIGKTWAAAALVAASCCPAWAQMSVPAGASIDLAGGSFVMPCIPVTMAGELTLGTGTFETGTLAFGSGATVTGTGGQLNVSGDLTSTAPLDLGTSSVVMSDSCAPGTTLQLGGNIVVKDLTLISTGSTPATIVLPAGTNLTVLGKLTLGTPGHPVVLSSSGPGTAVVTMGPLATLDNASGSTVPGNVQIGAAPPAPAAIPTLNTYGLLLLSMLVGGLAIRRQRHGARI